MMSQAYQDVLTEIKNVKMQVQNIRKRKKSDRTPEEMLALEKLDSRIKDLQKEKIEVLVDDMSSIADDVNSKSLNLRLTSICMRTRKSSPYGIQSFLFAMKQLLHNMKRTFKIEMLGRHQIMTSIKRLLNMSMPIFIIRTDITGFLSLYLKSLYFKRFMIIAFEF